MTKKKRRYNNVINNINGLEVDYTDFNRMNWKCIIIAAPKLGAALKPLSTPKHIRAKVGPPRIKKWHIPPEDPKFCFLRIHPAGIRYFIDNLEETIETKKLDANVFGTGAGGNAVCPF